jgi:SAM-dependent MidA family methyltransferase
MTEIEKIIKRNIKSNGTISIEEYMTIALYHPKYGYYSKKILSVSMEISLLRQRLVKYSEN